MVFWARRKPSKPSSKKMDFFGFLTRILGTLAAIALILVLVDQIRHASSTEFTRQQIEKRDLVCFSHSREIDIPESVDAQTVEFLKTEMVVYQLFDELRQEVLPTDTWGKLRTFSLCSSFSKVGISGFEASGAPRHTTSVVRIVPEDADKLVSRAENWRSYYPILQISGSLKLDQVICEIGRLKDMSVNVKFYCDAWGKLQPIQSTPDSLPLDLPDCMPVANNTQCKNPEGKSACLCQTTPKEPSTKVKTWEDSWLLVTGADQSFDATKTQVQGVQQALAEVFPDQQFDVEVRMIRSWKRTVVVLESQEQAQAVFEKVLTKLKYGGYLRNQGSWCPDYQETPLTTSIEFEMPVPKDFPVPVRQCESRK